MLKKLLVITLLGLSSTAFAGGFQVKVGGSVISPTDETKITGLGTLKADYEHAFTPSVEYFLGDTPFSAEILLATPISHDVSLDGTKVAKLKHLPPTITAKYNFKNATGFTPYIGVGGTAFVTWDEKGVGPLAGDKVKVKEEFGFAGQLGFTFQPADAKNWGVFFDARYAQLSPEVKINGTKLTDLDINPMVYTLGYSYKF